MMGSAARVLARVATLSAVLLAPRPAQGATVVMVRPEDAAPVMLEALVRLRGELSSVGLSTEWVASPVIRGESAAWLESLAGKRGADAVVAFLGDHEPTSVEVFVVDRASGRSVARAVTFATTVDRAPDRSAIRAVELLRSSFAELDLTSFETRVSATPAPARPELTENLRASGSQRLSIEMGGVALMSLDGVGLSFLPTIDVGWMAGERVALHAMVAGFGSSSTVEDHVGRAQVSESYGLVGGRLHFRKAERLQPFLVLAAGALRTSVDGRSDGDYQGRSAAQWSFLLDGGMGASVPLHDHFYLTLALHAHLAEPYPAVRFSGAVVATAARPNLLLTLTAGASL